MTQPNITAPDTAVYGIDRENDRWSKVGDAWRYTDSEGISAGYGVMTTADLVITWGPIRWHDANSRFVGQSGGDQR